MSLITDNFRLHFFTIILQTNILPIQAKDKLDVQKGSSWENGTAMNSSWEQNASAAHT